MVDVCGSNVAVSTRRGESGLGNHVVRLRRRGYQLRMHYEVADILRAGTLRHEANVGPSGSGASPTGSACPAPGGSMTVRFGLCDIHG